MPIQKEALTEMCMFYSGNHWTHHASMTGSRLNSNIGLVNCFDVTNILTISCKYLMPPLSNKTWILKHESQTRDMYYKCSIYSQFY